MRRAVVALAAGALLAGCGLRGEDAARPLTPEEAPVGLLSPSPAPAQPPGARAQQLVFVRDARLVPVTRSAVDVTPQTALDDLLAGPTEAERAAGLATALPAAAGRVPVRVTDGTASVDVGGAVLESGRSDQVLALAQVVVTLDALPDVSGVLFLQDDAPLPVPRADGAISSGPLTTQDYLPLLARE